MRGKTTFVTYADHLYDDRLAFWCAAPPGAQQSLVEAAPERFFVPPYVGGRGWLGVWLDGPVAWDELADLVTDAYRTVEHVYRHRKQGQPIRGDPSGHAGTCLLG